MKVALPSRGNDVDQHFGHCEHFTLFTVEGGAIVGEERYSPPPGCGCKSSLVPVLKQMGVGVLLAGNIGPGAVHHLTNHGIDVVRGCSGDVRSAAEAFLAGSLRDAPEAGCGGHHGGHHGCPHGGHHG